jgi:hypothetical protein
LVVPNAEWKRQNEEQKADNQKVTCLFNVHIRAGEFNCGNLGTIPRARLGAVNVQVWKRACELTDVPAYVWDLGDVCLVERLAVYVQDEHREPGQEQDDPLNRPPRETT